MRMPGQPKRVIKIAMMPARAKGVIRAAKKIGLFVSIVLKSFESRFIILPSYWVFAVYWEIFESLE